MEQEFAIQLFENKKIRCVWDAEREKYYFSIVDVVSVLTESADGRKYWNKLKQRLKAEGNESVTNSHQLKLPSSDGKMYKTDVADMEQLLRLIQSIPSKKAEPLKRWLAEVGSQFFPRFRTINRNAVRYFGETNCVLTNITTCYEAICKCFAGSFVFGHSLHPGTYG